MNSSELESSRKKRKRSQSSSSLDRSRAKSRDRKKSKKDKKSRRSKSKKAKRKRSKSKSGKRKNKKDRSRSRSPSESEEKYKYQPIPPMDPMMGQYLYYPPHLLAHREPRMRPPMFYPPPYTGEYNVRPVRPPIPIPIIPPIAKPIEAQSIEQPTDKIVKDQNFLNSDEKLFESIINNETSVRTIFEDTQISENYAGSILYKTLRKVLHDPNTVIFESYAKNSNETNSEPSKIILPKFNEVVKIAINHIRENNSFNKLSVDIGDMSDIKEMLKKYRAQNSN
jgi:hypothetical protein